MRDPAGIDYGVDEMPLLRSVLLTQRVMPRSGTNLEVRLSAAQGSGGADPRRRARSRVLIGTAACGGCGGKPKTAHAKNSGFYPEASGVEGCLVGKGRNDVGRAFTQVHGRGYIIVGHGRQWTKSIPAKLFRLDVGRSA